MRKLAIVIPLYNPHNDWFDAICNSITGLDLILENIEYNIVLVNDGSTNFDESTIEQLKKISNKIYYFSYLVNKGKGYAIRYGLNRVQADYYIYTDIDFPFGHEVIKNIYDCLNNSSTNLVIGIRSHDYFKLLPIRRKIISKALKYLNYLLTNFKVHDTQSGLKGFDNDAKKVMLETETNEFIFDFEFIHKCLKKKLKYHTIEIHPRLGIKFSDFRNSVFRKEIMNILKIIFSHE